MNLDAVARRSTLRLQGTKKLLRSRPELNKMDMGRVSTCTSHHEPYCMLSVIHLRRQNTLRACCHRTSHTYSDLATLQHVPVANLNLTEALRNSRNG